MLEGRAPHGSLIHLNACSRWLSVPSPPPPRRPRGGKCHQGGLACSLGQLAPSPPQARELCPCRHRKQGSQIRGAEAPLCEYKGSHSGGDPAVDQLQPQGLDGMPSAGVSGGESKALLSPRLKGLWVKLLPQAGGVTGLQGLSCGRWRALESGQPRLWRATQKKCGLPSIGGRYAEATGPPLS